MSDGKNWFERMADRALGTGEFDKGNSHYESMSQEEREELAKYAKDPKGYIDNARANMLDNDAAHRSKVNAEALARYRQQRDEEDRRRQEAIDSTLEDE